MRFVIAPPGHFAVEVNSDNEIQARKMARLIYGFSKLPNNTLVAVMRWFDKPALAGDFSPTRLPKCQAVTIVIKVTLEITILGWVCRTHQVQYRYKHDRKREK